MPQMAPINWTLIYIYIIMLYLILLILNFYLLSYTKPWSSYKSRKKKHFWK
uniref:ATP synthase complex subunit 8 n=1 Tax=Trigonopterus singkawangensis TaxID=1729343 RepID=A0A7H1KHZ5_9CUCU|nr:ATP synthase F0 subunit 8 [Trigonopterus singkawangensis]QNT26911.1 ATP synthase F0 subunit 8 [Trigonopterus singkawangensis]